MRNHKPKAKMMKSSFKNNPIIIPNDLIQEILQKLPVKSLVRFKSLSKQWRSTIQSLYFVKRHMNHQRSLMPKVLYLPVEENEDPVSVTVLSVEDGDQTYSSYELSGSLQHPLRFWGSCDGLVCLCDHTYVYVINPVTRETRKLPLANTQVSLGVSSPSDISQSSIGIGIDKATGTHKVVLLYQGQGVQDQNMCINCEVFALDTGLWRSMDPIPHGLLSKTKPVHIGGSLYWLVYLQDQPEWRLKIIAFDLRNESFREMPHLSFYDQSSHVRIFMYGEADRLKVLTRRKDPAMAEVWVLSCCERWEKLKSKELSRRREEPSMEAREYLRQNLALPDFCIPVFMRFPELLSNGEGRDVNTYFESLISVYQ